MTRPDRGVDLNPPCTARTGIGVAAVVIIAIALVVVGFWWWLQ